MLILRRREFCFVLDRRHLVPRQRPVQLPVLLGQQRTLWRPWLRRRPRNQVFHVQKFFCRRQIQASICSSAQKFGGYYYYCIVIIIVISKFLKRYSKAKRTRAPAYSRALRQINGGFPKGRSRNT